MSVLLLKLLTACMAGLGRMLGLPYAGWKLFTWTMRQLPGILKLCALPLIIVPVFLAWLCYFVPIDATTRLGNSDVPTITPMGGANTRVAVVYNGGAGSSSKAQISEHLDVLAKYGRTYVTESAPNEFSADKIIELTLTTLTPDKFDEILFVGGSKGGLLSHDTAREMRKRGDMRPIGIVLIDSPFGGDDVIGTPEITKWLSILPAGSFSNAVFSPGWFFEGGDISKMSPHVNQSELKALWDSYETWRWSCWTDEARFVFYHGMFHGTVGSIENAKWAFVHSEADTFVDGNQAYENWRRVVGPVDLFTVPKAGHISFHDWPREYSTSIDQALASVNMVA